MSPTTIVTLLTQHLLTPSLPEYIVQTSASWDLCEIILVNQMHKFLIKIKSSIFYNKFLSIHVHQSVKKLLFNYIHIKIIVTFYSYRTPSNPQETGYPDFKLVHF